jgi:nitroimidazol reductase NimA-like FMN-containing flavoprotein (pyridoxamine 5'-phosphate oxidase superfamily)
MPQRTLITTLDPRFSSPGASATEWAAGLRRLREAPLSWLATVRPGGRPHVAPLLFLWLDGALYFCTGADERKAKNLAENPHCVLLTGCNSLREGLDVVVESDAVIVTDDARLQRIADAYVGKYGEEWRYTVRDGAFSHGAGSVRAEDATRALVYELVPTTAFGFGRGARGASFSQTRWRFAPRAGPRARRRG